MVHRQGDPIALVEKALAPIAQVVVDAHVLVYAKALVNCNKIFDYYYYCYIFRVILISKGTIATPSSVSSPEYSPQYTGSASIKSISNEFAIFIFIAAVLL